MDEKFLEKLHARQFKHQRDVERYKAEGRESMYIYVGGRLDECRAVITMLEDSELDSKLENAGKEI